MTPDELDLFRIFFLVYGIIGGTAAFVCAVIFAHSMTLVGRHYEYPPPLPPPPYPPRML